MDSGKVLGFALIGLGVTAVGAAIYVSTRNSSRLLGKSSVSVDSQGGYKVSRFEKKKLPIKERVAILQEMTAAGVKNEDLPINRKHALQITHHCKARDKDCEAKAIYRWNKKNIRYTGDIGPHALYAGGPVEGVDLFQSARRTREFLGGDCDDHAQKVCTDALLNGLACKYRVTSPRKGSKDDYTHIYAMIGLPNNRWVAVDTTLPGSRYNIEAPYAKKLDFVA